MLGRIDEVKVFSATKFRERQNLGDEITKYLRDHPGHEVVREVVTQSSDNEYHCLSITLFMRNGTKANGKADETERKTKRTR